MRLQRSLTLLASLVAAIAALGLTGCTPVAPAKPDPIAQTHAGYVMYPNQGKSYEQVNAWMLPPSFICLPKQNSTVRWFIAMDGIAGASNLRASARAGLILGCKNGSPSYVPYYAIYSAGKTSPDKQFAPVRINPGDYVNFAIGPSFGSVEFQLGVSAPPGHPKRPAYRADIFVPSTAITGTAIGCLLEAQKGAAALPKATPFTVLGCSAYTDLAGSGLFWAPNHGNQATRLYNISTKSGKPLTRVDAASWGRDGLFDIIER